MTFNRFLYALFAVGMMVCMTGCYRPPYNNFHKDYPTARATVTGAALGTTAGLISSYVIPGLGIGAATGTVASLYRNTERNLLLRLAKQDIQYVEYGNLRTLVIPIDGYYEFNSARLNELSYEGLDVMIKLLSHYPQASLYVAAFSDNVGSDYHQEKMTEAQAQTMLTFLWAHGFKSAQLHAQGYGDFYAISDNNTVHGSAQNRRVEIQWTVCKNFVSSPVPLMKDLK